MEAQLLPYLTHLLEAALLAAATWALTKEAPKLLAEAGWRSWVGLALQSAAGLVQALAPAALAAASDAEAKGATPEAAGKAALDVLSQELIQKFGPSFKAAVEKQLGPAADAFFKTLFSGALASTSTDDPAIGTALMKDSSKARLLKHLRAVKV